MYLLNYTRIIEITFVSTEILEDKVQIWHNCHLHSAADIQRGEIPYDVIQDFHKTAVDVCFVCLKFRYALNVLIGVCIDTNVIYQSVLEK